jgi:hypothetical protein
MCSYIPIIRHSELPKITSPNSNIPKSEQLSHHRDRSKENPFFKRKRASLKSSEPIKCPGSSYKEEADSLRSYYRDVRYYDSLTWAMYHRITQARGRKKKNANDITYQEASMLGSQTDCNRVFHNSIPSEFRRDTLHIVEEDIFPFDM